MRVLIATTASVLIALISAALGPYSPAQASVPRTVITILVSGCEGCTVGINRGDEWGWADLGEAVVRRGVVHFVVPRSETKGIALFVEDPHAVRTNANAYATFRYGGQRVGGRITRGQAMRSTSSRLCSAGLTQGAAHWHLRVAHVVGYDFITGQRGYDVRPYFSPGLRTYGTAYKGRGSAGTLINGDFYCKQSG